MFAGERLQGSWVLVRMKSDREGGKRTNWLLIKHRDEYTRDAAATQKMIEQDASVASGRTMSEIAAGKGRAPKPFMLESRKLARADAVWNSKESAAADQRSNRRRSKKPPKRASKSAAKVPDFIEPELCKLVEQPPSGDEWAHEAKLDGYRMQLRVAGNEATLKTRKGLDWTDKFQPIADLAAEFPDCIIDGEVAALDTNGAPDFSALQAALSDGNVDDLVLFAFDLLHLAGTDLRKQPLRERKALLKKLLESQRLRSTSLIRYVDHFEAPASAVLESACRMNLEGIISKRVDAPYRSGRSGDWTKAKCRAGHEVVIGGWTREGGHLRSLLVGVHRDSQLVPVGRVGTGFGRDKANMLMKRLKPLASDKSPFTGPNAPRGGADVQWVKPKARRRDRVRRLDGLRQRAPSCIQRPARRQACAGRRRGAAGRRGGNGNEETCTEARAATRAARRRRRTSLPTS